MGRHLIAVLAAAAMVGAGCGGDGGGNPDARRFDASQGEDAPVDAAVDAAIDAAGDAPVDATVDAPADAAPDATVDANVDATVDATVDAAPDANVDASPPDANVDANVDADPADAAPDANLSCTIVPMTTGVSTVAGCDIAAATDGDRTIARFHNPVNVAVAADGTIYVADFDNDRLRRVTPAGDVTTLTQQPDFRRPFGLAFAPDGTLYVETDDNPLGMHSDMTGTIWRVDLTTGVATPLISDIGRPRGIVVLTSGLIVMSDYVHHVVRLLDPVSLVVTPLAGSFDQPGFANGNGPDARFDGPYGVAEMPDGSIAVADFNNHRIRRITLIGNVTTLAGNGTAGNTDGPVGSAMFSSPEDLALDATGRLYVADTGNSVVRRIDAGTVETVVGSGVSGYLDHPDLLTAQLFGLEGIAYSSFDDKLYIADGSRGEDSNPHHRVRSAILTSAD